MTKYIDGRITLKHDTDANWQNASDFVPLEGEIIIYDADDTCAYARLKIGDGAMSICDLPFVVDAITNEEIDAICGATIYEASEVTY